MKYAVEDIVKILDCNAHITRPGVIITDIIFDSRIIQSYKSSAFIALKGIKDEGHNYIADAYNKGIRNFIINKNYTYEDYKDANFIQVDDTLKALQSLAIYHRKQLTECTFIAITGSNGKTTIKEWLFTSLSEKKITQSPNSYNSQIGVALSILQVETDDEIALIEAGISKVNEMDQLQEMILPDIGLFTNIGDAHSAGFSTLQEKISEKLKLFINCEKIIFCSDHAEINKLIQNSKIDAERFDWGKNESAKVKINMSSGKHTILEYNSNKYTFEIKEKEDYQFENKMHLVSTLLLMDYSFESITKAISNVNILPNRLEVSDGKNNNLIINDTYSFDLKSLQLALEYLTKIYSRKKVVILSNFEDQKNAQDSYLRLHMLLSQYPIDHIWLVGIDTNHQHIFNSSKYNFGIDLKELLLNDKFKNLSDSAILIKSAHKANFKNLVHSLSRSNHNTRLETNFSALKANLDIYKSHLNKDTKIMAVIKADAYGSGSNHIAHFMAQNQIEYLAVAVVDEGIKIRQSGCTLPILVFNIQEASFSDLFKYNLEPEVYSISLLKNLSEYATAIKQNISCHLKIETGLNRLGLEESEFDQALKIINDNKHIKIKSIFSHLAASGDKAHDSFTQQQIDIYQKHYDTITNQLATKPIKHILNTSGVVRFKEAQFDMVRLGIGLYGIDDDQNTDLGLEKVHSLEAQVLQIKSLSVGETTGYNRKGRVDEDSEIAVISIGYADGLPRLSGNGQINVRINNKSYPTIGNICMDVSMILLPLNHNIKPGDRVIIFDDKNPIEVIAKAAHTISYEIISRLSPRIRRLYTFQ